jgi:hypothetical protein
MQSRPWLLLPRMQRATSAIHLPGNVIIANCNGVARHCHRCINSSSSSSFVLTTSLLASLVCRNSFSLREIFSFSPDLLYDKKWRTRMSFSVSLTFVRAAAWWRYKEPAVPHLFNNPGNREHVAFCDFLNWNLIYFRRWSNFIRLHSYHEYLTLEIWTFHSFLYQLYFVFFF